MLDLSYFQNNGNVNTKTFTNAGTWVTWTKPRGAKFVNIYCVGSGGGGGGGAQISGSSTESGGGGGGGGGTVRAQFLASVLPDLLYIYTGVGGTGGTGGSSSAGTDGGNGEKSYVCLTPDTSSASNIIVTSGNVSARGGGSGSASAARTAAGETGATATNAIFLNLGTFLSVAGSNGQAGNTSAAVTIAQTIGIGGCGGNSPNGAGNGYAAVGPFPALAGGITQPGGSPNNAGNGLGGVIFNKPCLAFYGGTSGGSTQLSGTGRGGNGGNGAYGGGGGGGGCSQINPAGDGGRGGDGIIIITTSF
jgi:hypothetical protein